MHEVSQLRQLIDDRLEILELPSQPSSLYDPIRYMLAVGGKRMRPILVLIGCEIFKGDIAKALSPAAAVEVFHNFTLLHDDIMDNAPLRRTKQTVHEKWNRNIAILSGDAMFVKSSQLLMQTDDIFIRRLMELFNKTALQVCEGQQYDMDFEIANDISLDDYLEMINLKTAVLLGCALQMGAIIGNASNENCIHLYETGRNLGMAFQIQDDMLDLYGSEEQFGKLPGGDIVSNKKTFLLLKTLQLADEKQRTALLDLLNDKSIDEKLRVQKAKIIFDSLNILQHAEDAIEHYYTMAMLELNAVRVADENKQQLILLAQNLRVRVV